MLSNGSYYLRLLQSKKYFRMHNDYTITVPLKCSRVKNIYTLIFTFNTFSHMYYVGPHSPPEHVQSIVTSSKSVIISWEPPAFVDQNGPIVYYILVIREQQFNLSDIVLNVTGRTNYTLSSLEEYNTYSYQVAAASRVGVGPYSDPILFTTLQDGKYTHVQA